jgi:hypothetical protein
MSTETEERVQPKEPYYRRGEQGRRWGAILLLVGLVWLVFALFSRVPFGVFGGSNVERSAALPAQSFPATRVVISGVSDTVTLVPGDAAVLVEATKYGYGWNAAAAEQALNRIAVHTEQRGDTLRIEVRRESGLTPFSGRSSYVDLRIAVPEGVAVETNLVSGDMVLRGLRGDATLASVSGNIELDDVQGDLRVNLTSGDLEIADFSGALQATSVSGAVSAGGAVRSAQITTTSGDVVLEGVNGPIAIRTISGSIRIADARAARLDLETTSGDVYFAGAIGADSRISTISGNVELRFDNDAAVRIDARTVSGDLEVDDDLGTLERERRRVSGTLGAGGPLVDISTTSGDVRIGSWLNARSLR